jgi:hypothetical protein
VADRSIGIGSFSDSEVESSSSSEVFNSILESKQSAVKIDFGVHFNFS